MTVAHIHLLIFGAFTASLVYKYEPTNLIFLHYYTIYSIES